MESFKLPKENKEDINKRNIAIQKATKMQF
jgi:formiminotetrahydrofolate cyclodeaminase